MKKTNTKNEHEVSMMMTPAWFITLTWWGEAELKVYWGKDYMSNGSFASEATAALKATRLICVWKMSYSLDVE